MNKTHHAEMSKTIASLQPVVIREEQQEAGGCLWERTGHIRCGQKGEALAVGCSTPGMGPPRRADTASWGWGSGTGHSRQTEQSAEPIRAMTKHPAETGAQQRGPHGGVLTEAWAPHRCLEPRES